jgi:Tol biopolymer transport system component
VSRTFALLAAIALIAFGCTSNDSGGVESGPPSGEGALVMARPDGIVELSLEDGDSTTLVAPADASEFYLDVAVSPDGTRVAYTLQPPAVIVDGLYDAGSDLWVMNRDGSDAALLFKHAQPNQLVRYPQWQGNSAVLAVIQEIRPQVGVSTVDYTVQRVDAATGARERILDNALVYNASPDGTEIAFAQLDAQTGESLFVQTLIDGQSRLLLNPSSNLQPFNQPRYSPDGARIAFASADQRAAPQPPGGVLPRPGAGGGRLASPGLDGLPQDVWIIDAAGGAPALLADLQEDFPSLTWDGSGEHIYVLGAYGLYDVDLESGNYTRIGEGAFHGSVAWAPELP